MVSHRDMHIKRDQHALLHKLQTTSHYKAPHFHATSNTASAPVVNPTLDFWSNNLLKNATWVDNDNMSMIAQI